MSATIHKWIIVCDDENTEEKIGTCPADFADDLEDVLLR